MRFRFIFNLCLLLSGNALLAQEKNGTIGGQVVYKQQALEQANIALLQEKDSVLLASAVSDNFGNYQFSNISEGRYLIQISHLSFFKKTIPVQLGQNKSAVSLPPVELEILPNTLQEVTATGKKALFAKEKGKLVFNVENSVVASLRSDVIELISTLPGVWIDRQSNILLNGQERVRVTINEKPTYLSRGDLLRMLKAIPIANVKAVEIISNPSAKYDAEGSAVINIKTKEHVAAGFVGNINTAAGSSLGYGKFYPKLNPGIDLSFGQKNFSLFANYSYGYKRSLGQINERLTFDNSSLNQGIKFENLPETSHALSSGIDVRLGDQQSLALFYTKSYTHTKVDQSNLITLSDIRSPGASPTATNVLSTAFENPVSNQDAFNFSYQNAIDSLNSLSLGADYIYLSKDQFANYQNAYLSAGTARVNERIVNNSSTGIKVWAGQLDYSHNFSAGSKLEGGLKYSRVNTSNGVDFTAITDAAITADSVRQNEFAYRENLAAIYLNYKTAIKKLSMVVGARYEDSKMSGSSTLSMFRFKRDFSGFFPSLSLDHPLSKAVDLGFSYSRRIARPNYVDINPFIYYVNPYVSLEGNPGLLPSYTNKFELSTQLQRKYSFSVAYLRTKDVFTTAQFQDIVTKTQRLVPANVGNLSNYELNLGIPLNPVKWWESNFNVALVYQKYTENPGVGLGYGINQKTTFQLFSQHAFSLPKDFSLELDNTLITPSIQGQFTLNTIYSFSAGLKKSFFNKKLDLKLGINDFLKTLKYDGKLQGIGWRSDYQNSSDSRQLRFSLSYNFYEKGKVAAKNARWISNDEKRRMKN